jgi:hypothetical protein
MDTGQLDIIPPITIVVIFIIGAILLVVGDKVGDKKRKQTLSIVGTVFIATTVISLFINSAKFREILVASAAVSAAIIAGISIYQSRQIREDSIKRESRDRKERWFNEVAEWLRKLEDEVLSRRHPVKSTFEDMLQTKGKVPLAYWLQLDAIHVALTETSVLSKSIREAEYFRKLTSKLDEGLSTLIGIVVSNLKQRRELVIEDAESRDYSEMTQKITKQKIEKNRHLRELVANDDRPLEGLGLSNQDITTIRLGRNAKAIRQSVLDALDRTIELKTNLIES